MSDQDRPSARVSSTSRFYDNTKISSYKDCPRKYFLRHVLDWRGDGISLPLAFGLSWHSAMDTVWLTAKQYPKKDVARMALSAFQETWQEQGLPVDLDVNQVAEYAPRTPMIAREMLVNYIETRWNMMQLADLMSPEQPFAVPMPTLHDIWYAGRMDKVIRHNGQVITLEHKTTSEYKKDGGFKTTWIESWYSDSQVKGYEVGSALFYEGISQVWVDGALVHKNVHDAFRFIPVAHGLPILQEWIADTAEWIKRLERDTTAFLEEGKLLPGVFPKNENSCMGKYGSCSYIEVCRNYPDPSQIEVLPGYVVEKWEPFDILGLQKLLDQQQQKEQQDGTNN